MPSRTFIEAIHDAMQEELRRDASVFVIGALASPIPA